MQRKLPDYYKGCSCNDWDKEWKVSQEVGDKRIHVLVEAEVVHKKMETEGTADIVELKFVFVYA